MSILATLMLPTSGVAKVDGYDVTQYPKEVRKRIGYMPDFFGVYDQLKATEYLHFYGASYGIPRTEREQLIPQLLELVNLSDKADAYVDTLSRGMKQRLCLARCLVHDPEVLILDEPASGLDSEGADRDARNIERIEADGENDHYFVPHPTRTC